MLDCALELIGGGLETNIGLGRPRGVGDVPARLVTKLGLPERDLAVVDCVYV